MKRETAIRAAVPAAFSITPSSVVSTVRSRVSFGTIWRTWPSTQSTKYCAGAVGAVFQTFGVWAADLSRWAGVIAPVSTMAFSTSFARSSDRSGCSAGL